MNLMTANTQWMKRPDDERFQTLGELKAAVEARRKISRAEDVVITDIRAENQSGELVLNSRIHPSTPSHWSFGQMSRLIGAPAGYLRGLPLDLTVKCINHGLEKTAREEMKFMTLRNDADHVDALHAVTSKTYGRIWDADVVKGVQQIVERTDGKFFNPKDWSGKPSGLYASDRDIFVFMIDGGSMVDGGSERDQMHRGFITWNSEVGSASFGLMTFLFRVVCGNHIIWDAQNVNKLIIRHTSGGPERFAQQAAPALLDYVNQSTKPIEEAIRRAKMAGLPGDEDYTIKTYVGRGFTRGEVRDAIKFAKAEEGSCSNIWELVQGFTASARSIAYIDERINLEKRAGDLLKQFN
jgi:hypothetical protein